MLHRKLIIIGLVGLLSLATTSLAQAHSSADVDSMVLAMENVEINKGWLNIPRSERMRRTGKMGVFIPRGTFIAGGTAGFTSIDAADYKFMIMDNIKARGMMANASIFAAYSFTNNVAAGISLKYNRMEATIDNLDLSLSEDMSFGVSNFFNVQQTFSGTAFLRTYITIGRQRRIGMYNDIEVYFGGGSGKNTNSSTGELTGTYQKISNIGLLLSPGIVVFATDFMSVEAGVSIFGIEYSRCEQISNQVYVGTYESFTASFKLNLLKVNLGLAFYF